MEIRQKKNIFLWRNISIQLQQPGVLQKHCLSLLLLATVTLELRLTSMCESQKEFLCQPMPTAVM